MICTHCGEELQIIGEQTVYYDAWSVVQATLEFPDQGPDDEPDPESIINSDVHFSGSGEGDTSETTYEFRRSCCDAPVEAAIIHAWDLEDPTFFEQ